MAQNMMTSEHKTTNEKYRKNYDLIFQKKKGNYNVNTEQRKFKEN